MQGGGLAERVRPILAVAHLPSARQIAAELNRRGIKSATGGQWSSNTVTRLRERLTRNSQSRATSHSKRRWQSPKRGARPDPPHRPSRGCFPQTRRSVFDTARRSRLLVTMLPAIAEFERELIRERTGEGRKRAMQNGVRFGRKPKLSDFQRKEAMARRDNGETLAQIARSLCGQCEYDQ